MTVDIQPYLMDLLILLETTLPPDKGAHHAIHYARYGSDETGWEAKLALSLRVNGQSSTLFFDKGDFLKPISTLVDDICTEFHRGNDA